MSATTFVIQEMVASVFVILPAAILRRAGRSPGGGGTVEVPAWVVADAEEDCAELLPTPSYAETV